MPYFTTSYSSPLGPLILTADKQCLCSINWGETKLHDENPVLIATVRWLDAYFGHQLLPALPRLNMGGTVFQERIWQLLLKIPYGTTITYGELARLISPTMSPQAIGHAIHCNPLPILIPCHRVVAAQGLGGYAYGIERKIQLLEWEGIKWQHISK